MDTEQLLAPEESTPLGRSRADVLDMLPAAEGPLGVREIAQRMGLHANTARFPLEALVEADAPSISSSAWMTVLAASAVSRHEPRRERCSSRRPARL